MNQSPDERQLRALLQRAKQADDEAAPTFEEVLNRPMSESHQMLSRPVSPRRAQVTIAVCVVAALLLTLFVRQQPRDSGVDREPNVAENSVRPAESSPVQPDHDVPTAAVVSIDFDELLNVIEQNSDSINACSGNMSVWSSGSDSLLAFTLNASLSEE